MFRLFYLVLHDRLNWCRLTKKQIKEQNKAWCTASRCAASSGARSWRGSAGNAAEGSRKTPSGGTTGHVAQIRSLFFVSHTLQGPHFFFSYRWRSPAALGNVGGKLRILKNLNAGLRPPAQPRPIKVFLNPSNPQNLIGRPINFKDS